MLPILINETYTKTEKERLHDVVLFDIVGPQANRELANWICGFSSYTLIVFLKYVFISLVLFECLLS